MNPRLTPLLCLYAVATFASIVRAGPEESVVKVYAAIRFPDPTKPWAKGSLVQVTGTGVVIEGNRILTNSHIVEYGTEVSVQARPGDDKVDAKIEAMNFDVDLAILRVKDEKFFQKRPALPRLKQLPSVPSGVSILGFPIGGQGLSVTKGEVSRIDSYNYGYRGVGLIIQVSASINPGNSGGPAMVGDKMAGLVVSRFQNAQNIGYVIPNEEIEIFLNDLKDGRFDGKAVIAANFWFQKLENKSLRRKFKIESSIRGVLVLPERLEAKTPLKPYDVLSAIGEYPIDNAGMIQLKNGMRVSFSYMVARATRDEIVPFTGWRQGREVKVALPVTTRDRRLLRPYEGEPLAYFIHGPLVFAPGKSDDIPLYAQMTPTLYIANGPLVVRRDDFVRFAGEELVVVSARMFTHPIAKGYSDPVGKTVKDINGIPIKSLRHLVETLRDSNEEFLTFHFADNWSETLVFDRREMEKATEDILEDNGIAANRRGSPDLLRIWNQGK